jgi:hypothetical protein
MKRTRPSTSPIDRESASVDHEHDDDLFELQCLERLAEELDHPNNLRRQGARAAIGWLIRIVDLRSSAPRDRETKPENDLMVLEIVDEEVVACSITPRNANAPAPRDPDARVEDTVVAIERAIFDREKRRHVARGKPGDSRN